MNWKHSVQKAGMAVVIIEGGVTAISLDDFMESTNLYPNPTTGQVNIVFGHDNNSAELQLQILDLSGKIYKKELLHLLFVDIIVLNNFGCLLLWTA